MTSSSRHLSWEAIFPRCPRFPYIGGIGPPVDWQTLRVSEVRGRDHPRPRVLICTPILTPSSTGLTFFLASIRTLVFISVLLKSLFSQSRQAVESRIHAASVCCIVSHFQLAVWVMQSRALLDQYFGRGKRPLLLPPPEGREPSIASPTRHRGSGADGEFLLSERTNQLSVGWGRCPLHRRVVSRQWMRRRVVFSPTKRTTRAIGGLQKSLPLSLLVGYAYDRYRSATYSPFHSFHILIADSNTCLPAQKIPENASLTPPTLCCCEQNSSWL